MKVLVVEDHGVTVEGIRVLLKYDGIKVVDSCSNGIEVIEWLKKNESVDVIILDYQMPKMDGGELLQYFKATNIEQKVLVVSEFVNYRFVTHCIENGANGYLCKTECHEYMAAAIKTIALGGLYFSKTIQDVIINYEMNKKHKVLEDTRPFKDRLSNKQQQILRLILQNCSNDEIKTKLNIDDTTLRTHTQRMREKLNVNTNIGLVTKAIKANFE